MASSNSPCAACKFLRRKCTQECVFAPYFPPDQPTKFSNVHKVFGASNVAKLLNDLNPAQREDAVNSLAYEAEARLQDPVYGCVGFISILQHKLRQVQHDLELAKKELASYIGPSAMLPLSHPHHILHQTHQANAMNSPFGLPPVALSIPAHGISTTQPHLVVREQQQQMIESQQLGIPNTQPHMVVREQQQQQQMIESQQLAAALAAREHQELIRSYRQHQQQKDVVRFTGGFNGGGVPATSGINMIGVASPSSVAVAVASSPPSIAHMDNPFHMQLQQQEQHQHSHPQQTQQPPSHLHQPRAGSEERSVKPPSP